MPSPLTSLTTALQSFKATLLTHPSKATLIGISGGPSSGKTTLAHLVAATIPIAFTVDQNDFLLAEAELPNHSTDVKDANCPAAFDMSDFLRVLDHVRAHGELPDWFQAKQIPAATAGAIKSIGDKTVAEVKEAFDAAEVRFDKPVVIVDGPFLYHDREVCARLHVRLMTRPSYPAAKKRRLAGAGRIVPIGLQYRTHEYFDQVVWPSYVEEYGFLFQDDNVEGGLRRLTVEMMDVKVQPELDGNMADVLQWAIGVVTKDIGITERDFELCNCHIQLLRDVIKYGEDLLG
ncbi:MAG: ribosylnicotinamide kinase [Piccolia ochrophora]|nr:MAG: ribosylnicotinamide kinase [Piccolia ochrophora]